MAKKSVLGKGIGALLNNSVPPAAMEQAWQKKDFIAQPEAKETQSLEITGNPVMLSLDQITTNKNQPRKIFKEAEIEELANSIRENGIIQPLVVSQNEDNKFEIIAGERRYRAAKKCNLERVPVVVKKATKKDKLAMAIIENVQRSDLNCVEEALAYFQLMQEFQLTQEEVAKKIGKDRSTIANFLRILKLPKEVILILQKEELSFGHAKLLAAIKEREVAAELAVLAVDEKWSVRELEKQIKGYGSKPAAKKLQEKVFDKRSDSLRVKLEKATGFHFDVKIKNNGSGQVVIKFNDEDELSSIFDYLTE